MKRGAEEARAESSGEKASDWVSEQAYVAWRDNVATPEPGPTRMESPNRNPEDTRLFLLFSVLLNFLFQKCSDPNPWPDPNGGSEPEPGLLRRFHLS